MLAVYAPIIGGRNVNPWPRLTNSSHLSEWCQETSLSKNVKVWILRANHHEPPRHQPSDDFAHLCTLGRSIIEGDAKWDSDLRFTGKFCYTKGYWEWTEDVLSRCGDRLHHLKIYDAVYASLFTYDHNSDIVKAFCEAWCPLTNTLLTSAREMSISLWDLHELVGLPMTSCLYDEVVLSTLELTGVDEKREIYSSFLFIIEPYSPHRFGRQFGYYQDVPGTLRCDTCVASLEEGLRYWRLCVLSKSSSRAWFPCLPTNAKKLCSEAYKAWWAKIHGTFFDDNIACLIRPKSIKITLKRKKDKDKQVDDSDSSNKDRHWKRQQKEVTPLKATETNENASRSSLANFVAEVVLPRSLLKGESFLFNYQKEFLQRLWSGLIVKISNTPVDFLSSIEDNVYIILESMKSFQKFDVSKVEESLNMFFAKVHAYDEARSLSSEKLSQSLHEQKLEEVKARLQDVQAKASEEASEIQSAMDELEHVEEDIAVLKGRRMNLSATLKEKKKLNHDTQAKVREVEKDLAALESIGPLDDAIVQNLESSRANLGILTEDLKSLNPFA
ncbi:UNVERIFIED_CONTAM: hypothetical protein Sangu_2452900 [Sesamum angustifolium]|uniref:Aminotransferase-like plant mobile domain-containing protein n=1 Tax=Sesamum angustifolium TaxID=2727405 RepID=A0AAW2KX89_9LAMI